MAPGSDAGGDGVHARGHEAAAGAREMELVPVAQLALAHGLAVHLREVRGAEVEHEVGAGAPLDAGMGARDERLVHADVRVFVAADEHDAGGEGKRKLLAVRPHPDQARLWLAQFPPRREASGATDGPSLLKRVASLKPAAAR